AAPMPLPAPVTRAFGRSGRVMRPYCRHPAAAEEGYGASAFGSSESCPMRTRVLAPDATRTTREGPAFGRIASLYAASASLAAGVLVGEALGLPLGESLLRAVGFA